MRVALHGVESCAERQADVFLLQYWVGVAAVVAYAKNQALMSRFNFFGLTSLFFATASFFLEKEKERTSIILDHKPTHNFTDVRFERSSMALSCIICLQSIETGSGMLQKRSRFSIDIKSTNSFGIR